jgi:hypothetical protein
MGDDGRARSEDEPISFRLELFGSDSALFPPAPIIEGRRTIP